MELFLLYNLIFTCINIYIIYYTKQYLVISWIYNIQYDQNGINRSSCSKCRNSRKPLTGKDRTLVRVLLLITLSFLLLNLPQLLRAAIVTSLPHRVVQISDSKRSHAVKLLLHQITNNMCNVNYACNFIIYSMSGSRFRADLRRICGCYCTWSRDVSWWTKFQHRRKKHI